MNLEKRLSRVEVARALRLFLLEGAFSSLWGQLAGGVVFTGLALYLGANTAQIGVLAALPALANLTQVGASFFGRRIQNQERLVLLTGSLHQCLWASAVLVPLLLPKALWISGFGIMIGLGSLFASLSSPAFNAWFAEVVPANIRASYISRRSAVIAALGMVGGISAGRFLDLVPGYNGFAIMFGLALIFGLLGKAMLLKVSLASPAHKFQPPKLSFSEHLRVPLADSRFIIFCGFHFSWSFVTGLVAPFQSVFLLKNIGAPYFQVAAFTAISTLSTVLAYRPWGYLLDRFGNTPVVQLTFLLSMPLSLFWFFASKGNYLFMIGLVSVLGGLLNAGSGIAINNMLYSLLPQGEEKANYWAFFASVTGIASASAPIIAGQLARHFSYLRFQLFVPIGNLQLLFLANGILLALPLFLFRRIGENAVSLSHLLKQLRSGNPFGLAYYLRQISQPVEEKTKVQAVRSLGKLKSHLATDEIVKALDDASSAVRKEAALALGEIKDPGAVGPLSAKVQSPESGIQADAALALGKIPDYRGAKALLAALDDADRQVKISAICALGEIGGDEARAKLFSLLERNSDCTIEPSLLEALSKLGETRIVPFAYECLNKFRNPVVQLQILSAVARVVGEEDSFYKIISLDELAQAQRAEKLLRGLKKRLDGAENTRRLFQQMQNYFENDDYPGFVAVAKELLACSKRQTPARDALRGFLEAKAEISAFTGTIFILLLLEQLF